MKTPLLTLTLAITLLAVGCIEKETLHGLYLEPDGALTWSVLEKDVRSSEQFPAEREREEQQFLDELTRGNGEVAHALRSLGGSDPATALLRSHRPYLALTESRFPSIDGLALALLDRLGLDGDVRLDFDGDRRRLLVTILVPSEGDASSADDVLAPLLADADAYRLVLTGGRFLEATGFDLFASDTEARLRNPSEEELADGVLELGLVWQDD